LKGAEITSELQVKPSEDVRSNELEKETCEKSFDESKSNNFLYSCYYCDNCETNIERDYQRHVIQKHPGKSGYPGKPDLEKYGIPPKGKSWEI